MENSQLLEIKKKILSERKQRAKCIYKAEPNGKVCMKQLNGAWRVSNIQKQEDYKLPDHFDSLHLKREKHSDTTKAIFMVLAAVAYKEKKEEK